MNKSRRAHYRRTLSATITATSRGFTGTFKNSVWGEFKMISKQSAGLQLQQLCLLRSTPWLGCVWGLWKTSVQKYQNRQNPTVDSDSKGCQERWSPSMAASMSFDNDFFIIIFFGGGGIGCYAEKKPSAINKIQQKTPSLTWVRSIFNRPGVLSLTGPITLH